MKIAMRDFWHVSLRAYTAARSEGGAEHDHCVAEQWPNEGQINRLKTLKRALYGRAGVELLRARMLPFRLFEHAM
jgi:hypothetical protein